MTAFPCLWFRQIASPRVDFSLLQGQPLPWSNSGALFYEYQQTANTGRCSGSLNSLFLFVAVQALWQLQNRHLPFVPERVAGIWSARSAVGLRRPPLRHRLQLWCSCARGGWHGGAGHLQWPFPGEQTPAGHQKRWGIATCQNPQVLRREKNNSTWTLKCEVNISALLMKSLWKYLSEAIRARVANGTENQGRCWL